MRRPSREISTFSLSAIDLFACATGAFLLLAVILLQFKAKEAPESPAIPQPTPRPEPVETPRPTPPPSSPEKGFQIQVPLGVDIEWQDRGVDIDLHVEHKGEVVFYGQPLRPWGILTKDEIRSERQVNREMFFVPRFDEGVSEGNYKVYVAYFGGGNGNGPYAVSGRLVAFPGTANEVATPFTVSVQSNSNAPPPLAVEFDVSLSRGRAGQRDEDFEVRVR